MGVIEIAQVIAAGFIVLGLPLKFFAWDRQRTQERIDEERRRAQELGAMRQQVDEIYRVIHDNGLCRQVQDCGERISRLEGRLNDGREE